jgi:hypothetical protein
MKERCGCTARLLLQLLVLADEKLELQLLQPAMHASGTSEQAMKKNNEEAE